MLRSHALSPNEILRILEVTDSFNIHREAVVIPLTQEEKGSVTILPDSRLRIICPSAGSFDDWLNNLRRQLERFDLSKITKH
jgi:hypothetical protein